MHNKNPDHPASGPKDTHRSGCPYWPLGFCHLFMAQDPTSVPPAHQPLPQQHHSWAALLFPSAEQSHILACPWPTLILGEVPDATLVPGVLLLAGWWDRLQLPSSAWPPHGSPCSTDPHGALIFSLTDWKRTRLSCLSFEECICTF